MANRWQYQAIAEPVRTIPPPVAPSVASWVPEVPDNPTIKLVLTAAVLVTTFLSSEPLLPPKLIPFPLATAFHPTRLVRPEQTYEGTYCLVKVPPSPPIPDVPQFQPSRVVPRADFTNTTYQQGLPALGLSRMPLVRFDNPLPLPTRQQSYQYPSVNTILPYVAPIVDVPKFQPTRVVIPPVYIQVTSNYSTLPISNLQPSVSEHQPSRLLRRNELLGTSLLSPVNPISNVQPDVTAFYPSRDIPYTKYQLTPNPHNPIVPGIPDTYTQQPVRSLVNRQYEALVFTAQFSQPVIVTPIPSTSGYQPSRTVKFIFTDGSVASLFLQQFVPPIPSVSVEQPNRTSRISSSQNVSTIAPISNPQPSVDSYQPLRIRNIQQYNTHPFCAPVFLIVPVDAVASNIVPNRTNVRNGYLDQPEAFIYKPVSVVVPPLIDVTQYNPSRVSTLHRDNSVRITAPTIVIPNFFVKVSVTGAMEVFSVNSGAEMFYVSIGSVFNSNGDEI